MKVNRNFNFVFFTISILLKKKGEEKEEVAYVSKLETRMINSTIITI
jgi:hypothetical protein